MTMRLLSPKLIRIIMILQAAVITAQAEEPAAYLIDSFEHAREPSLWSPAFYDQYDHESFENFVYFHDAIDFTAIDYPLINAALYFETNRRRVEEGVSPLPWNLELEITAYNHSRFMVDRFEFAHYSSSMYRRTPNDRARLAGITNPQVTENIAIAFGLDYIGKTPFYVLGPDRYSYTNEAENLLEPLSYLEFARRTVDLWMDSPSHRRNLLTPNAVQLGTGAFFFREANSGYFPKFRATQNFQWWTEVESRISRDPLPPGYRIDELP